VIAACATALVLLLDISISVDDREHRLQREAVSTALRDPAIGRLVEREPLALVVIEWHKDQHTIVPWRVLTTPAQVEAVAREVDEAPRPGRGWTWVGSAIQAGLDALAEVPCTPEQMVMDVSGDGRQNAGPAASVMRDRAAAMGVQINGLAILTDEQPDLEAWYRENVQTPDGFVIGAAGFEDMARAMRRKLIIETATNRTSHHAR
jgi:Ca-activated chloride channel homolog